MADNADKADVAPQADDPAVVQELDTATCWALLRAAPVSRIAVCATDGADIFPVNHVVDHGTVVVRTAPGTKLTAASNDLLVAIEADGTDESTGSVWSVVLRGRARPITGLHELVDVERLSVAPWQGGVKHQ